MMFVLTYTLALIKKFTITYREIRGLEKIRPDVRTEVRFKPSTSSEEPNLSLDCRREPSVRSAGQHVDGKEKRNKISRDANANLAGVVAFRRLGSTSIKLYFRRPWLNRKCLKRQGCRRVIVTDVAQKGLVRPTAGHCAVGQTERFVGSRLN